MYFVLMNETQAEGAERDQVTVATQSGFETREAADWYASSVAPGRAPLIVEIVSGDVERSFARPDGDARYQALHRERKER